MRLIPEDMADKLMSIEMLEVSNPAFVRDALERVLVLQFKAIAESQLAWLLLKGADVSILQWWHFYAADKNQSGRPLDLADLAFKEFKREFARRVALRAVRAISPVQFSDLEIVIVGCSVGAWDEVAMNRQLSAVGSTLRLAVPGANSLLASQLYKLLESSGKGRGRSPLGVDSRFILGHVGPVTACPLGPVLDFEREVASSPLIRAEAVGFSYDDRTVVRRSVWSMITSPEMVAYYSMGTLAHEAGHVSGGLHRYSRSYLNSFWEEDTESDLCRFLRVPATREMMRPVFWFNFDNPIVKRANELLGKTAIEPAKYGLDEMLDRMLAKGLLVMESDGRLRSSTEGTCRWHVF